MIVSIRINLSKQETLYDIINNHIISKFFCANLISNCISGFFALI